MADNFKYVQAQQFALAGAGAVAGATEIILESFEGIDGTPLTMADFGAIGFGTHQPGEGTAEEQISFTGVTQNANGTATLTGVSTVLFISPYTASSGLAKTHAGNTVFIISNTSGFYDRFTAKANDETITGLWAFPSGSSNPTIGSVYVAPTTSTQIATKGYVDSVAFGVGVLATDTVYGYSKLSVAAADPLDPIVVGTNDGRVPTQAENDALQGTSGSPSNTNRYVTNDDTATAATADKVARRLASGDVTVPSTPSAGSSAASKTYVDSLTLTFTNGTATKNAADASTTQNIAHGLGKIPKKVRIFAIGDLSDGGGDRHSRQATTVYNGTTQSSVSYYQANAQTTVIATTFTLNISATNSTQTGVVTFDSTNIIITWTSSGTPSGTYTMVWEAEG